jgi:uncharacterized membrane protein YphA (DoxX/SURF4 family)
VVKAITQDTLGPLLLRLGLAAFFITHALGKLFPDNDWGALFSDSSAATSPFALGCGELAAGVLLGVGLLTRLAALAAGALTIVFSGALPLDIASKGFAVLKGENGYNIVTLCACTALVLTGAGNLSLDRAYRWWRKGY